MLLNEDAKRHLMDFIGCLLICVGCSFDYPIPESPVFLHGYFNNITSEMQEHG